MALPWTFGVELEFCVAFVYPHTVPLPDPDETRKLRFKPREGEIASAIDAHALPPVTSTAEFANRAVYREQFFYQLMGPAVRRDIVQMLHEAGFPVHWERGSSSSSSSSSFDGDVVSKWQVVSDGSIFGPEKSPYLWTGVEVKSPALAFNKQSLRAVEQVCRLITKRYIVQVNTTTGLHVHCSAGLETNFRLQTMQNLFAFLYAFEPQLDSIHPPDRQNNNYAHSIRVHSIFTDLWWKQYGQMPTLMQGVLELLKKDDMLELMTAVCYTWKDKSMRYNSFNMFQLLNKKKRGRLWRHHKRTIEFRQHEGTLEPERVVQWVKTVVGIINVVDTTGQDSLKHLLRKVEDEKWTKEGSAKDAKKQEQFGPIPAEGSWTIIDLFRYMHLHEQADYYQDKLNQVVGTRPEPRLTVWKWEYEEPKSKGRISDDEFQKQHKLRLLWEQSLRASLAQPEDSSWTFDPDDQKWPNHVRVNKWPEDNDHEYSDDEASDLKLLMYSEVSDPVSQEEDDEISGDQGDLFFNSGPE
jgi:hypothetical protein